MSEKVVSLATRRRKRLGLVMGGMHGQPVNREAYDAWIEADGSLVLRFDMSAVEVQKGGAFTNTETGEAVFRVRANGHEVRIAADVAEQWFKDMQSFGIASRRIAETRRGVYEWQFEPIGDGAYRARHAHRVGIFEPFKPKLRKRYVGTGEVEDNGICKFERKERRMVAPDCDVCRRVIQAGETAYRERRNSNGRAWPDAVICVDCITKTSQRGIREVATC